MTRAARPKGGASRGPVSASARSSAAQALGAALGGKYSEGVRLISPKDPRKPRIISTGIDALDVALGTGGAPEGRSIILHGPEACGKTTAALELCASWQREGAAVVYLDWERKLDLAYAEAIGVDLDGIVYVTPPYLERGLAMVEHAAKAHREADKDAPIVFVWDSYQAAPAKNTYDNEYEKESFSPESRAYSRGLMKLVPVLADTRALFVGISQVRMKMAAMPGMPAQQKVAVGNAPLFYASIICEFRRGQGKGNVDTGREGEESTVVVRKNQLAAPFRVARFPLKYGAGVDVGGSVLSAAIAVGLAEAGAKKGGWWFLKTPEGPIKVQGAKGVNRFAQAEPEKFAAFRAAIRAEIGKAPSVEESDETSELETLDE